MRVAAVLCAAIVLWTILRFLPDSFIVSLFCRIPAELAALFYNAELQKPELLFEARGVVFHVARSCAATDFFVMCSTIDILVCRRFRRTGMSIVLFAYLFTLLVNTIRLIFLVPATAFMYNHLPVKTHAAFHQFAGTIIFLTAFIILWEFSRHVARKHAKRQSV